MGNIYFSVLNVAGYIFCVWLSRSQSSVEANGDCFFNACILTTQRYCYNEGKCMFNETTCKNYCECAEGFVGSRCEMPEVDVSPTDQAPGDTNELPSVEDRTCSPTFVCLHGICDGDSFFLKCICENNWTGIFCDTNTKQTTQNTLTETDESYSVTSLLTTTITPAVNSKYNVCSENVIQRHVINRTCTSNLVCEFGVCDKTLVQHVGWRGWEYACICDPGAVGLLCEHACCLDCGENGICQINNGTEYCQCDRQYTGKDCDVFVPDPVSVEIREATWYIWIVGACAGTLLVLLILSVVAPYLMWKHRVILIMKIVHYFQAYEDDDDKQWDAFVSYKSDTVDENFVVQYLYPKLEKEMGFKLCLHFRDFIPGETIANNIINAVEGSRRTILVMTPRYIESEFTRFEYQKAQQEMLKQKHRIIPILLEDISSIKSTMDKNLQGIIDSVTYLEWPDQENTKKIDKFWKRLQLSLPKLKDISSEMTYPSTATTVESHSPESLSYSENSFSVSPLPVISSSICDLSDSANYCSSETIYTEISAIDEPCEHSEIYNIKPLSEKEELDLIESGVTGETTNDITNIDMHNAIHVPISDNIQSVLTNGVNNFNRCISCDNNIEQVITNSVYTLNRCDSDEENMEQVLTHSGDEYNMCVSNADSTEHVITAVVNTFNRCASNEDNTQYDGNTVHNDDGTTIVTLEDVLVEFGDHSNRWNIPVCAKTNDELENKEQNTIHSLGGVRKDIGNSVTEHGNMNTSKGLFTGLQDDTFKCDKLSIQHQGKVLCDKVEKVRIQDYIDLLENATSV